VVRLSNRERDLLRYLIDNRGRILTRDELLEKVWEYSTGVATRTIDTHVLTVRKKLGDDATHPRFIQTLHGVGYQFIGEED
jgi:DNA-binding response OmpR family regulator